MPKPKAKLNHSHTSAAVQFEPSPTYWETVENVAGALDDEKRAEILWIIESYFTGHAAEQNATPVDEARRRLKGIRSATVALIQELSPHDEVGAHSAAAFDVECKIDRQLNEQDRLNFFRGTIRTDEDAPYNGLSEADWVENLEGRVMAPCVGVIGSDLLPLLLFACDASDREYDELAQADHFMPGAAWRGMAGQLADFFRKALGRNASASKDYTKEYPPSPFVQFVDAVQSGFPKPLQRHRQSLEALSGSLSKVLAEQRAFRDVNSAVTRPKKSRTGQMRQRAAAE